MGTVVPFNHFDYGVMVECRTKCMLALLAITLFFTNVSFIFTCSFLANSSLLWADYSGPRNSKHKAHTLDDMVAL